MLLLRVYEQWIVIYFVGDHFSVVMRGMKLYVIVLVCLDSAFVGMCCRVLVCGRKLLFMVLCRNRDYFHVGTDALSEVTNMDADIPQEGSACPSSHDHDCFRVHFCQIVFHGKP